VKRLASHEMEAVRAELGLSTGEHVCETCLGTRTVDETLGGYSFSNPRARCPDCDGRGYWRESWVGVSPAGLAKAFWNLGTDGQSEFMRELARVIREDHKTNPSAYSYGEKQWHFLAQDMDAAARNMLMTMAAPLYLHTLNYIERREV